MNRQLPRKEQHTLLVKVRVFGCVCHGYIKRSLTARLRLSLSLHEGRSIHLEAAELSCLCPQVSACGVWCVLCEGRAGRRAGWIFWGRCACHVRGPIACGAAGGPRAVR